MSIGIASGIRPLTQGLTQLVEKIDASKLTELVVTDVGAMVIPRTWIEYSKRGSDAGRETLIREIAGTLLNCFISGWLGLLALFLFQHPKSTLGQFLNPKGMDFRQWIQGSTLDVFGQRFVQQVRNPSIQTTDKLLETFSTNIFRNLTSTDHIASLQTFKPLSSEPVPGRLSPKRCAELTSVLLEKPVPGSDYIATLKSALHKSRSMAQRHEKRLKCLSDLSAKGGLTSQIHLKDSRNTLLIRHASQDQFLKELKAFLDQYIYRLIPKNRNLILTSPLRNKIIQSLYGKSKAGFAWLPRLQDGLIPYTQKSKVYLSLIPFITTVAISCSISWFNQRLTQEKHAGQRFFPGEKVFEQGGYRR